MKIGWALRGLAFSEKGILKIQTYEEGCVCGDKSQEGVHVGDDWVQGDDRLVYGPQVLDWLIIISLWFFGPVKEVYSMVTGTAGGLHT